LSTNLKDGINLGIIGGGGKFGNSKVGTTGKSGNGGNSGGAGNKGRGGISIDNAGEGKSGKVNKPTGIGLILIFGNTIFNHKLI